MGRKRGYHDFPSKTCCLTVPGNFVGGLFIVSLISGIENFDAWEGYVTIFCLKFCLAVSKFLVADRLSAVFQKSSGSEKLMNERGTGWKIIMIFHQNFLAHSAEKIRSGML